MLPMHFFELRFLPHRISDSLHDSAQIGSRPWHRSMRHSYNSLGLHYSTHDKRFHSFLHRYFGEGATPPFILINQGKEKQYKIAESNTRTSSSDGQFTGEGTESGYLSTQVV
jgi:hypothetical protein